MKPTRPMAPSAVPIGSLWLLRWLLPPAPVWTPPTGVGPFVVAARTAGASASVVALPWKASLPVRAAASTLASPLSDAALAEALPLQFPRTAVAVALVYIHLQGRIQPVGARPRV